MREKKRERKKKYSKSSLPIIDIPQGDNRINEMEKFLSH